MASIGHIAVGMAVARFGATARVRAGSDSVAPGSLFLGMCLWSAVSLLPDVDVVGLRFGIPYGSSFGHRGAAHSFAFLLCLALAIALVSRTYGQSALRTGLVAGLVLLSHPLLDVLTDGGLGCALLWPLNEQRYFAPFRPIPVAPIGRAFFSRTGLSVALVELVMFAPLFAYALWPRRSVQLGEPT